MVRRIFVVKIRPQRKINWDLIVSKILHLVSVDPRGELTEKPETGGVDKFRVYICGARVRLIDDHL